MQHSHQIKYINFHYMMLTYKNDHIKTTNITIMRLIFLGALITLSLSVMYSINSKYQISLQHSPLQLAHCYYVDKARTDGWSQFYLYASSGFDLITQHRAAGYLEGYSTFKEIYYAYTNFYNSELQGNPNLNIKIKDFVDQQLDWIDYMYQRNSKDSYWQQAYALVQQLRYMYKGFIVRVNKEKSALYQIGFSQFYYLTNMGDLEDIIPAFSEVQPEPRSGQCNAFIKAINGKLYITQSTFNKYQLMLRFHKIYSFPSTRESQVASEILSFTSRPGDLQSKDDFYLTSGGLAVVQTSLQNFEPDNYKMLSPNTVPTWIRHLVANRLAKTPSEWANIFLKYRSYTHNNQWLIVDMNRYNRENVTEILMVEEGFAESSVTNFTDRFNQKGFVASYNVPYDSKVYKALHYEKHGFNYQNDPRATQFAEVSEKATSYDILKSLLLTNNNEDPCDGIAPRCDLKISKPRLFGMVDQKIASSDVVNTNTFQAISGPPTSNGKFQPFNWSNWPNITHMGMPEVFNFTWVTLPFDYESKQVDLVME